MKRYIIRLDDASTHMDLEKWNRVERLLDQYGIKPIFGIIPDNHDASLVSKYDENPHFWPMMSEWIEKGWIPAMHGYQHKYVTKDGGINPVNQKSEFAGLSYEEQAEKIRKGWEILVEHDIKPDIFFAPSHTFDENTLKALEIETPIRIISDTPAWDIYKRDEFTFIPQQCGNVRWLPFRTSTFCYHPNSMENRNFEALGAFLAKYGGYFKWEAGFSTKRKRSITDKMVFWLYFVIKQVKKHNMKRWRKI